MWILPGCIRQHIRFPKLCLKPGSVKLISHPRCSRSRSSKSHQVKTVEKFVEVLQVQPCASPAVASTTPQVITPDPSDECSRARGGAWVHRAHTSEESTCVGEETSTGDDDEASAGGSEDWVVRPRWRHNRRPRRDRRRKARIRRDEYLAAQQAAFLEAQHEGGAGAQTLSVLGALLEGIAEDEGDWAGGGRDGYAPSSASTEEDGGVRETTAPTHAAPVGASIAPQVLGKGGILPRAKMAAAAPIEDIDPIQEPASKKARTDEALDVLNAAGQESSSSDSDATSEGEGGSGASSRLEEVDGDGLLEHELLEGLDKGVESLPASLVWTMVHIQEAADRWQVVDDPTGPRSALSQGVTELRPKLRRVKAVVRRLSTTWDCPRFMLRQWEDLQDWLLEGEDGPGYQLQRFKDLLEEVSERGLTEELDKEWLKEEIAIRSQSLQRGWGQFVSFIEGVAFAKARHACREQRRVDEATSIQEAISARLAMSLGCRCLPD